MDVAVPARQQRKLDDLRWHWPVYQIAVRQAGQRGETWTASAAGTTLTAGTAAGLRLMIRRHYARHPELRHRSRPAP